MKKKILIGIIFLVLFLGLFLYLSNKLNNTQKITTPIIIDNSLKSVIAKNKIVVAITKDSSYEAKLIKVIAKKIEVKIELKEVSLENILKLVNENSVDIGLSRIELTSEIKNKFLTSSSYVIPKESNHYVVISNSNNKELIRKINETLRRIKADEELDEINKKK